MLKYGGEKALIKHINDENLKSTVNIEESDRLEIIKTLEEKIVSTKDLKPFEQNCNILKPKFENLKLEKVMESLTNLDSCIDNKSIPKIELDIDLYQMESY